MFEKAAAANDCRKKSYPTIGPKIRAHTKQNIEIMQVNGFAISSPLICFLSKLFICGGDRMRSKTMFQ